MTRKEIEILLLPIHSKLQNIVCELVANGFDTLFKTKTFIDGAPFGIKEE